MSKRKSARPSSPKRPVKKPVKRPFNGTKKKKMNVKDPCPDTSRCIVPSQSQPLKYQDNLKVEETLEKDKEIKESDIFEGLPPKSKKNGSKLKN